MKRAKNLFVTRCVVSSRYTRSRYAHSRYTRSRYLHPSEWLRVSALTCRLISLVGVIWSILPINKHAFPPLHAQPLHIQPLSTQPPPPLLGRSVAQRDRGGTTPDLTRSNCESQLRRFWARLKPKMDQSYLGGSALEPLLFAIAPRKI